MSKKLINTLKYGSRRTKRKIYLMSGTMMIGAVLAIIALLFENMIMGLAAFLVIFIVGLMFFNTSFEQKTVSVNHKEKTEGQGSLARYDENKLKRILVAYKVKKHHVPVMIDMCQTEKIVQSPAYMWKDATYLYFLVLEEEARLIKSKLSESNAIHIRRGMPARPMEEYTEMNEPGVVSMIFGSLLPKYYKKETGMYRTEYRKNLYSAAPGIWCTSASVKNMLKLLPENFVLDDNKTEEESTYYQEIYIARLMYWDGVYSGQEYKGKVLEILDELIRAEIADYLVTEYLDNMMQKGLIPREYADYVISKRKDK